MTQMSRRFLGFQERAAFDLIRDISLPNILSCAAHTLWSTFSGAQMLNMLSDQVHQTWLLARRASNYRLLHEMIANQQKYDLDYLIPCLVHASYVDSSGGNEPVGRMHMRAAINLIQQRGEGLRCLQVLKPVAAAGTLQILEVTGIPIMFEIIDFREALENAIESLRALQAWIQIKHTRQAFRRCDRTCTGTNPSIISDHLTCGSLAQRSARAMRHHHLKVKPLFGYLQDRNLPDEKTTSGGQEFGLSNISPPSL